MAWFINALRTSGNEYCGQYEPMTVLFAIPVAYAAIQTVGVLYRSGVAHTLANGIRRATWWIPAVRRRYDEQISTQFARFQKTAAQHWTKFGKAHTEIPQDGMSEEALSLLIERYRQATHRELEKQQITGGIYSKSFTRDERSLILDALRTCVQGSATSISLRRLFLQAFEASYLWNPLHAKEFAAGQFIHFQLIRMLGEEFGARPENIAGFVTSGGTESLMTAARAYMLWGVREKGLREEECVILAPHSIHAALIKAQIDYRFQLVLLPTDETGRVLLADMHREIRKHGKNIVAIFGSAPSYPMGKIDPIAEMVQEAKRLGCGMHVDCCLGGLVVEFLKQDARYLNDHNITSLSVDPHKNGLAPKGCSVLLTQRMPTGKNLAFYPIYAIPDWSGGMYATPTMAGSQSSVAAFCAFLALLHIGKNGYRAQAERIHRAAVQLGNRLSALGGLEVLGGVEANVVAFRVAPRLGYETGATYGLTHLLQSNGFTCSNLRGDAAHFCVTDRFASDESAVQRFSEAAITCLAELPWLNVEKIQHGTPFPGEASLYGDISSALKPDKEELSWGKYFELSLFGKLGVDDATRAHVLARINPDLAFQ